MRIYWKSYLFVKRYRNIWVNINVNPGSIFLKLPSVNMLSGISLSKGIYICYKIVDNRFKTSVCPQLINFTKWNCIIADCFVYLGRRERTASHRRSGIVHWARGLSACPALCHHSEQRAYTVREYLFCCQDRFDFPAFTGSGTGATFNECFTARDWQKISLRRRILRRSFSITNI